jgi:hypothetical protein
MSDSSPRPNNPERSEVQLAFRTKSARSNLAEVCSMRALLRIRFPERKICNRITYQNDGEFASILLGRSCDSDVNRFSRADFGKNVVDKDSSSCHIG